MKREWCGAICLLLLAASAAGGVEKDAALTSPPATAAREIELRGETYCVHRNSDTKKMLQWLADNQRHAVASSPARGKAVRGSATPPVPTASFGNE